MKDYENQSQGFLLRRTPCIIRVDGRSFHSYTKGLVYPYDVNLSQTMQACGKALVEDISTAVCAYGQSDEISILLIDYTNLQTEQWFGGKVQKIVSTASSLATAILNASMYHRIGKLGQFDARVFSMPERDVPNYFYWRHKDCVRNSVSMAARAQFSHKELHNKSVAEMKIMLRYDADKPWEEMPDTFKDGWFFNGEEFISCSNRDIREIVKECLPN